MKTCDSVTTIVLISFLQGFSLSTSICFPTSISLSASVSLFTRLRTNYRSFDGSFLDHSANRCRIFRYVDELLYWSGRRLTLDECLRDDLTPHRLQPTWITHDKFVYQADDGSLTLLDTSNNSVSLLVSNHTLVSVTVPYIYKSVSYVISLTLFFSVIFFSSVKNIRFKRRCNTLLFISTQFCNILLRK